MGVSPLYGGILMQASVFNSGAHGCVTMVWGILMQASVFCSRAHGCVTTV